MHRLISRLALRGVIIVEDKKKLYVGNLPYEATSDTLVQAFSQFGEVVNATVIIDRMSNRSKGFGFVEFATEEAAQAAVDGMNGQELEGRKIVVNIARPQKPRE